MALNWNDVTYNWMQPPADAGDGSAGTESWDFGTRGLFVNNPELKDLVGEGGFNSLRPDYYFSSSGFDKELASKIFYLQK